MPQVLILPRESKKDLYTTLLYYIYESLREKVPSLWEGDKFPI